MKHFSLQKNVKYCVGLSGGVDSVVLLHALKQSCIEQEVSLTHLTAVHINHGISDLANNWQQFCENYCADLEITLEVFSLKVVKESGQGLENTARKARYESFSQIKNVDVIVLAHHQDDQYETMLSQIMRGSDLHNVAAMHEYRVIQDQKIWRPILHVSKKTIIEYADFHNLQFIQDDSNSDNTYLRNFLRNEIIPELLKYDNCLYNKLGALLLNIRHHVALVDEFAGIDLGMCEIPNGDNIQLKHLDWEKVTILSHPRQLNLLAYFIKIHCNIMASHKHLQEFLRQCHEVSINMHGATPVLKISNFSLIFNKGMISLHQM